MTDIPFPRSTRYDQPDGSGRETARWRWFRRGPQFRQRRPALTPGLRRLWKVGGVLWVLVALPFGAMQVATTLAHTRETVVKEFPAAGVTGVDIGNGNGSVTVVGSDTPVVRVTARISHGWARTGNDVELVDGRVRADTHCPVFFTQFCSVAYTVEVPRTMALTVDSDNGSVFASDLTGDVTLSSDNGRVEAERLDGDLRLSSSNGRVSGRDLRADGVEADSSNGRIELSFVEPPRVVGASSSNGEVDIVVPDDRTTYRVDAGADNGSVSVVVDQSRRSDNVITASSDNGAVSVRYAE